MFSILYQLCWGEHTIARALSALRTHYRLTSSNLHTLLCNGFHSKTSAMWTIDTKSTTNPFLLSDTKFAPVQICTLCCVTSSSLDSRRANHHVHWEIWMLPQFTSSKQLRENIIVLNGEDITLISTILIKSSCAIFFVPPPITQMIYLVYWAKSTFLSYKG